MRKFVTIFALCLGAIGAYLGYLSSARIESRFTETGVVLGYGPEYMTWFWRHCGQIGFILIMIAFGLELLVMMLNRRH